MSTTEQASTSDWQGLEPDTDPTRPKAIDWQSYADEVMSQWYDLLKTDPEESTVQDFLELHPAMLPGGSGDIGPGGHHGSEMSAVFRRPALAGAGPSYEPDFMWVTRTAASREVGQICARRRWTSPLARSRRSRVTWRSTETRASGSITPPIG